MMPGRHSEQGQLAVSGQIDALGLGRIDHIHRASYGGRDFHEDVHRADGSG